MRFSPRRLRAEELQEFQPRLWASLIGLLLLAAYVIAFVVENRKQVNVHFVFGTAHTRLVWVILLSLAIGLVAGVLLSQLYRRHRRKQ